MYQDVNCIIFVCCMLAGHELRKLSIPVSCKPLCVHQMRGERASGKCQLHSSSGDDMQGLYIQVHMCMHLSNKLCAKNGTYPSCNNTHQRDAAETKHRCVTCTDTEPNEGDSYRTLCLSRVQDVCEILMHANLM